MSPFSVFLMDNKKNPSLQGLSIASRGKALAKLYKNMSKAEKAKLDKRAAAMPSIKNKNIRARERRSKNAYKSEFSVFVKENYHLVAKLPLSTRFQALSQLYHLRKPIDLEAEMEKLGFDKEAISAAVKNVGGNPAAAGKSPRKTKATTKRSKSPKKAIK